MQSILNMLLVNIITKLTNFEKNRTVTESNISLAQKLSIAQFFNISIINFVYKIDLESNSVSNFSKIFGGSIKFI